MARDSTAAAMPAGNPVYWAPTIGTLKWFCDTDRHRLQLDVAFMTPGTETASDGRRLAAAVHVLNVASRNEPQTAHTARRFCQTTHALQHTIASPRMTYERKRQVRKAQRRPSWHERW